MARPSVTAGIEVLQLHAAVDRQAARLAQRHASRLVCRRGCSGCCVDDITVLEVEAERIRQRHAALLETGRPHPEGACAFLDAAGACRIYEDRPYVCRTQGLPLRWLDADERGATVELRDICPLNERLDEPLESLAAIDCWTLGPAEARLARIAARRGARESDRVALRDLFRGPLLG